MGERVWKETESSQHGKVFWLAYHDGSFENKLYPGDLVDVGNGRKGRIFWKVIKVDFSRRCIFSVLRARFKIKKARSLVSNCTKELVRTMAPSARSGTLTFRFVWFSYSVFPKTVSISLQKDLIHSFQLCHVFKANLYENYINLDAEINGKVI